MTKFKCGGIVLGVGFNHVLVDGKAFANFLNSWAEVARGMPLSTPPYMDRSILSARQPPIIDISHDEYMRKEQARKTIPLHMREKPTVSQSFCFGTKMIKKLRSMAIDGAQLNSDPTSFELISALIWIGRTKALGIKPEQTTKLLTATDGRAKFQPPLPKEYFGNGIVWSCAQCSAGDLMTKPFSFAVKIVHEAINAVTEDYIRSAIDYFEVTRKQLEYENTCWITKWSRLAFYEANFGWGEPTQVAPASIMDNLVVSLSQRINSENLVISLTLSAPAMETFKEFIQSKIK